jgi:hypothetical protein
MKFISFITSTILIVLISQYSITGAPLNDTITEEKCTEGFEKVLGHCVPISTTIPTTIMTTTTTTHVVGLEPHHNETSILHKEQPVDTLNTLNKTTPCPVGMEHDEHGICKEIKASESTITTTIITTTVLHHDQHNELSTSTITPVAHSTSLPKEDVSCPEGLKRDENGICKEIKSSESTTTVVTTTEINIKPTIDLHHDQHNGLSTSTTKPTIDSKILPKEDVPCGEGLQRDENGICKEIKSSESTTTIEPHKESTTIEPHSESTTTEINVESTTTEIHVESTTNVPAEKEDKLKIKPCPRGSRRDENGVCRQIKSTGTRKSTTESTTIPTEEVPCAEGSRRDENGICKEIEPSENTTTDVPAEKEDKLKIKPCPRGLRRDKDGVCRKIKSTGTRKSTVESTTLPTEEIPCAEGSRRDENGICKEIKPSEHITTTELNVESTTTIRNDKQNEVNLMDCPEGTKRDEDGACQEIQRSSTIKSTVDPKTLLKEDGSCPDGYILLEGRCLIGKSKLNSTLTSGTFGNSGTRLNPRVGKDESSQYELIPVLDDNSCPEGTEHAEFGLCRRRIASCPLHQELVNGKCLPKKLSTEPTLTKSTTIPTTDSHDELTESTPTEVPVTITSDENIEQGVTQPTKKSKARE